MKRVLLTILILSFQAPAVHRAGAEGTYPEARDTAMAAQGGLRQLVSFADNAQDNDGAPEPTISVRQLIGMQVVNPLDEVIGEVADLLVDRYGCPAGMVIRIGGFMGFGSEYVRIEIEKVNIRPDGGSGSLTVLVRETRQNMLSGE